MKKGMSLVELLVAMTIAALVMILVTQLFLTSHQEFIGRMQESNRMNQLQRLKSAVQKSLHGEVSRCEGGRLWVILDGEEKEMAAWLSLRFSDLDSLEFQCKEVDQNHLLTEWHGPPPPKLIEYKIGQGKGKKRNVLRGSWIP